MKKFICLGFFLLVVFSTYSQTSFIYTKKYIKPKKDTTIIYTSYFISEYTGLVYSFGDPMKVVADSNTFDVFYRQSGEFENKINDELIFMAYVNKEHLKYTSKSFNESRAVLKIKDVDFKKVSVLISYDSLKQVLLTTYNKYEPYSYKTFINQGLLY